VEAVPSGFKVVRTEYGETFFCSACDRAECAKIYMLTVILVLVGAAAGAIMVIAMWDAGAPALRRWRW
jgi:uncharacterized membrane protein YjgN (DUF898 family)